MLPCTNQQKGTQFLKDSPYFFLPKCWHWFYQTHISLMPQFFCVYISVSARQLSQWTASVVTFNLEIEALSLFAIKWMDVIVLTWLEMQRLARAEEILPNPDMGRLNGLVIPKEIKNSINASLSRVCSKSICIVYMILKSISKFSNLESGFG